MAVQAKAVFLITFATVGVVQAGIESSLLLAARKQSQTSNDRHVTPLIFPASAVKAKAQGAVAGKVQAPVSQTPVCSKPSDGCPLIKGDGLVNAAPAPDTIRQLKAGPITHDSYLRLMTQKRKAAAAAAASDSNNATEPEAKRQQQVKASADEARPAAAAAAPKFTGSGLEERLSKLLQEDPFLSSKASKTSVGASSEEEKPKQADGKAANGAPAQKAAVDAAADKEPKKDAAAGAAKAAEAKEAAPLKAGAGLSSKQALQGSSSSSGADPRRVPAPDFDMTHEPQTPAAEWMVKGRASTRAAKVAAEAADVEQAAPAPPTAEQIAASVRRERAERERRRQEGAQPKALKNDVEHLQQQQQQRPKAEQKKDSEQQQLPKPKAEPTKAGRIDAPPPLGAAELDLEVEAAAAAMKRANGASRIEPARTLKQKTAEVRAAAAAAKVPTTTFLGSGATGPKRSLGAVAGQLREPFPDHTALRVERWPAASGKLMTATAPGERSETVQLQPTSSWSILGFLARTTLYAAAAAMALLAAAAFIPVPDGAFMHSVPPAAVYSWRRIRRAYLTASRQLSGHGSDLPSHALERSPLGRHAEAAAAAIGRLVHSLKDAAASSSASIRSASSSFSSDNGLPVQRFASEIVTASNNSYLSSAVDMLRRTARSTSTSM